MHGATIKIMNVSWWQLLDTDWAKYVLYFLALQDDDELYTLMNVIFN